MDNNHVDQLFNLDAERAVLGSIIIDPPAIFQVSDFLRPSHFHLELHRWCFQEMLDLATGDGSIDVVTLEERLSRHRGRPKEGWTVWLSTLWGDIPSAYNIHDYGRIVEEHHLRRRMKEAASRVATLAHKDGDIEEQLGQAELSIFNIREGRTAAGLLSPRAYVRSSLDEIEERRQRDRSRMLGLPSGFFALDSMIDGFIRPFPYILAGRPGMGKSALAIQVATHNALRGKVVQYFTPEMTGEQLVHRIYAAETGIALWAVKHGHYQTGGELSDQHMSQIHEVAGRLAETRLFIDPTPGITPGQIRAKAMRCYAEHGIDLIIVDHLHEMQPDNHGKRHLELGDMMRSLKEVGKLVNAPILILAQLSRSNEGRKNKRPQLSDLRESGAIEEVAYGVLFIYREHYHDTLADPDKAEIIVAKNRDGETGTIHLTWQPQITAFQGPSPAKSPMVPGRKNGETKELAL